MARSELDSRQCQDFLLSSRREWLLTNGIGGFAMGTVAGVNSRRYHGLLVAAVVPPAHRVVLVPNLEIEVQVGGESYGLSANQYEGAVFPQGYQHCQSFSVDNIARWEYEVGGARLAKAVAMTPGENTTNVRLANTGTRPVTLTARPLVSHKPYHANFLAAESYPDHLDFRPHSTVVSHGEVDLHVVHDGWQREPAVGWYYRFENRREVERGLDPRDDAYCPCALSVRLEPGQEACLVFSDQANPTAFTDWSAAVEGDDLGSKLAFAAEKFLVQTNSRTSILAGYPWFTDWGRDTMISLPGICLATGKVELARQMITAFASQMRDGLVPNRFVETGETPEYNTADATLWFANACYLTLMTEWSDQFAKICFAALDSMFEHHVRGTRFGIKVDDDGLLTQGEEGTQLTWMDAKLGDWVVTPRRGKAVELNGLWVNACRVLEWLAGNLQMDATKYVVAAEKAEAAFDGKFWNENLGHYLDVADPDDGSLRPNQLFAISLPFGPATGEHARRAVEAVTHELLTPVGLRTLAPDSLHYRPRFRGPLQELDGAYHQGTVWPWLMGTYIEASLKTGGSVETARDILAKGVSMLTESGLGGIAEVYDGDEPREAAGCPWQAWSVAEWLRAWTLVSRAPELVE